MDLQNPTGIYRFLTGMYRLLHVSTNNTVLTASYRYLQVSIGIYRYLQVSTGSYRYLQLLKGSYRFFKVSTGFLKVNTGSYRYL